MGESPVVSFDDEPLIVVNANDDILGFQSKAKCHDGNGILHRAFSIFIFNDHGNLLLQQRSEQKRLWPMFWANTCCSHPRRGETTQHAATRRLGEELGLNVALSFLYKFQYHASFGSAGSEHEMCEVFVGHTNKSATMNTYEVNALRYVSPEALTEELKTEPDKFTPWLKLEWERLRRDHWAVITSKAPNRH